ncbi:amidase signature domain-containing protein [Podospora didyma]|uniref:Amidase signature domain-containing protein n=1 Tax=Podospora didyma TaxID=330526 RepID=A0AAE0N6P4_9PEZI|nr:amidase signature domain-containing protein [Podospora didyma]
MPTWEVRAAAKWASTLTKIPAEWHLSPANLRKAKAQRDLTSGPFIRQFLTSDEAFIVAMEATDIVEDIKDGRISAVRVTKAFCKAAAIAHQINNRLHEIFFHKALERARELDAYFADKGTTIGPLHGLPISLKDQFHVKGVDTTMGYVGWIDSNLGIKDPSQAHQVESQITAELLSLGAVLFCKTSLPQILLFGETMNNILGQTLNPHNQNLSCGGSSGGEGALQALRGSVLGVGTDIGGSVRIPAAFNGIFSLKPILEFISYRQVASTNPGQNTYRSTVGFLSTSVGGLELVLRSVLSTEPWRKDPAVVPIPFRQEVVDDTAKRPLKLGVLWTDGTVGPHPPITRGLHEVVIDWKLPLQASAKRVHVWFLFADGAHDIHGHLNRSGEPLIPDLEDAFKLRPPAAYSDYWNSTAGDDGQVVDAVIMPVAPHAAVIPGKYYHTAYTEAINLMNYSAAVIPVTKANKSIDIINKDDPDIYDGAPVGVHLVAREFEEEKILTVAGAVAAALKAYHDT